MEKFIPLEKMSKKKQREFYKSQRRGWGGISPVTRREKDPKAYNRAKAKRDCKRGDPFVNSFIDSEIHKVCRSVPINTSLSVLP